MSLVWEHFSGNSAELLVMLALADYANDDGGNIHPAMKTIAKKIRCGESTARRIVHRLIDGGVVEVTGNANGGKPGTTRMYRVVVEKLVTGVNLTGVSNRQGCQSETGVKSSGDGCQIKRRGVSPLTPDPSRTVINHQSTGAETSVSSTCPQLEIVKLYNHHLQSGTQVRPKLWNGARAKALQARWREDADRQNPEWWNKFFGYCAKSRFLTGQSATPGRDPFVVSLDWILKPANFTKILEGFYHREAAQ